MNFKIFIKVTSFYLLVNTNLPKVTEFLSLTQIFSSRNLCNLCPNLIDLSHILNTPKTGFNDRRLKSWKI